MNENKALGFAVCLKMSQSCHSRETVCPKMSQSCHSRFPFCHSRAGGNPEVIIYQWDILFTESYKIHFFLFLDRLFGLWALGFGNWYIVIHLFKTYERR